MPSSTPMLPEGLGTILTFSQASNIHMIEMELQPPGGDAGGAIETTSLRQVRYRTRRPKRLITLTQMTGVFKYNAGMYSDIQNQLGNNQSLVLRFFDLTTLTFYGWLDKFTPQRIKEGALPLADCVIEPSNEDNNGAEVAPVYAAATSTTTTTTTSIA